MAPTRSDTLPDLPDAAAAIIAALQADGRTAAALPRLRLAWQPVRPAAHPDGSARPLFLEGLARAVMPCGRVLTAGEFLPTLEAAGLVAALDRAALVMAVAKLGRDRTARLSVNLSALTLEDGGWHEALEDMARDDPDAARRLVVELTETAPLDLPLAVRARRRIGATGAAFALDDAGAGVFGDPEALTEAALALRPDIVKIDRRSIASLLARAEGRAGHGPSAAVGDAARRLAARLGAVSVAEGVPSADAARRLAALGVDAVQGLGLAPPQLAAG